VPNCSLILLHFEKFPEKSLVFIANSNILLKNKINCVSLFQITLYMRNSGGMWDRMWACIISWSKANLMDIFFTNFNKRLFYVIWKHWSDPFIVYSLIFENFAVQAWTISILEGCNFEQKSKLIAFTCKIHFVIHLYILHQWLIRANIRLVHARPYYLEIWWYATITDLDRAFQDAPVV
jgi:hypothetical protein